MATRIRAPVQTNDMLQREHTARSFGASVQRWCVAPWETMSLEAVTLAVCVPFTCKRHRR